MIFSRIAKLKGSGGVMEEWDDGMVGNVSHHSSIPTSDPVYFRINIFLTDE
jgi:hypothetical protein